MHTPKITHELAIVFAVRDPNPQSLNLDFLKYSGVVPADWLLAQPPIRNQQSNRLIFQNGVHIVAQPGTLTLVQPIILSQPERLQVPELAHRYVRSCCTNENYLDYLAIGVSPKSFVLTPVVKNRSYLVETLLHPKDWQHKTAQPAQATINLLYPLDRCLFRISIEDVRQQLPNQSEQSAVLVSGNFHYPVPEEMLLDDPSSNGEADRAAHLHACIDNWKKDLKTYLEIVNERFVPKKGDRPTQKAGAAKTQRVVKTPVGQASN
jgi:hypothetical protein